MPTDIEMLHQMISDEAKVQLQRDSNGSLNVFLTENQSPISSVVIRQLSEDTIVISLDDYWEIDGMFTHEKDQCKRADFVIITYTDSNQKAIIYLELKTGKELESHVVKQLTGAQCFITYCQEIGKAKAFWNQGDFLDDFEHRFVLIYNINTSINKKTTRYRPDSRNHDSPEKLLKISSPRYLPISRLIGR